MSDSLKPHEPQHTRPPCPSTNSQSLPKLMYIESVMPSNHLIFCRPLFLLPSIFPSIRVFSNESALRIRWPKDWSFRFGISASNEHPGLISFRMDWLVLLAVQGTFKSLLRESVPRQVDKESRGPQGERGLEFSRRKKVQTFFLSPHSLGLYNNNVSCLRTVFGLNLLLS